MACARKELTLSAAEIEKAPDAIAEQTPSGTSTWVVRPDGAVSATLKTPDGKAVAQPVTGQLSFAPPGGPVTSVPVQYDSTTGVLTAAGPRLDADITPVSYSLTAGGTPWTGSVDVPKGGTQELVETARASPPAPPTVGPSGGVVQTVGPDRVEIVAKRNSDEVRAYVLDADNKAVDPGDRTITIAVQAEQPEVVVFAPEPQAHFVVGHLRGRFDPEHLTVAVRAHGATHACLVGWSPGTVVLLGPQAPRVHLFAVDAWPGELVEVRGHHHGLHGGVFVGAPGVVVDAPSVVVTAPGVVVGGPGVVVGGPGVVVGGPGVVVGGGVEAHGEMPHGRGHDHGKGH